MRLRLKLLLITMPLLTFTACQRQSERTPPETAADTTAASATLLATTTAWDQGDLDAFLAPYDTASTFMTGQGPIGKADLKTRYAAKYFAGGKPSQRLTYDSLRVRTLENGYLLMTGRYLLSGSRQPDRAGWFTLLWRRTASGWTILHDHSS